ncbi:hypothetical protein CapIbe_010255 [Capra ibex]
MFENNVFNLSYAKYILKLFFFFLTPFAIKKLTEWAFFDMAICQMKANEEEQGSPRSELYGYCSSCKDGEREREREREKESEREKRETD